MELTVKDRELLAVLSEDARLPVAALAKRLGVSRSTAQARLERLERIGVIVGYGVRLSDAYASSLVRAQILITLAPKALEKVTEAIGRIEAVTELHSISGAFDLIAMVASPSITELDRRIDEIGAIEGVERTLSSIILSTRIAR
ncbi:transcriptional regulator, AsnC family [Fulvimarina manganoxydans]|uniref:Transcriptional regulator, AsnC family n=1 Tax=Fulvimarina manganoxydans TaxID=937218 RepID=A0A1W2EM84_9HYPH|nr:Lrp/AsnC family transcriptional regulator [Fulvimarina manganoxydans]MEE2951864.1 Lrp/AsnC family transcriptional regulator [Pseudomonadota bacterium]SMD10827.1 transcriptional regulator, AsnC family [Fulvimarina manganoxydans]